VLEELDLVLIGTLNTETGARGFLITGDPAYLEPYNSGKEETLSHLRRVKELTADNPTQQVNIDKNAIDSRNCVFQALATIIQQRQANELTTAEMTEAIVASKGKELQDKHSKID